MAVQIHGKNYVTVAERLAMVHTSGKSIEVIESAPTQVGDRWIWRAVCIIDGKRYVGSAEVHLNSKNAAEASDPWATGETSAVGRCLAWAGFGSAESIASADEVTRNPAPTPAQIAALKSEAKALGIASTAQEWASWVTSVLGEPVPSAKMLDVQIEQLQAILDEFKAA